MNTSVVRHCLCGLLAVSGLTAGAASPADLQQRIANGDKVTFVDVRSTALFQKGHIPGAINVPAALVPLKQLPPLGRVVVYDDGLGPKTADQAVTQLNQKTGITAEALDGGFAAWESAKAATTRRPGMKAEEVPVITYERLQQAQGDDVVLIDLRAANSASSRLKSAAEPPLSDLAYQFPKARVAHSPFEAGAASRTKSAGGAPIPPLLVLIDRGDGEAEKMARTLKANGISRFAILVGGEYILARKGEKGLQRLSATVNLPRQQPYSVINTNQ